MDLLEVEDLFPKVFNATRYRSRYRSRLKVDTDLD